MIRNMTGKRDAHERLPELIAAAVRVFTREGYRLARMSDVAAEMGLSEAAIYRYVGSKEGLFVLAIRHALLLEDLPAGDLPLSPASLAATVAEARDFIAEVVPFGALADALSGQGSGDTAAELEKILRELFELEARTREAADMLERSARELPEMADLLNAGIRAPVLAALTEYLGGRAEAGTLRRTPDTRDDGPAGARDADLVRPAPVLRPGRCRHPGRPGRGHGGGRAGARPGPRQPGPVGAAPAGPASAAPAGAR